MDTHPPEPTSVNHKNMMLLTPPWNRQNLFNFIRLSVSPYLASAEALNWFYGSHIRSFIKICEVFRFRLTSNKQTNKRAFYTKTNMHFLANLHRNSLITYRGKNIWSTSCAEKRNKPFTLHTSFPSVLRFLSNVSKTYFYALWSHKPFHLYGASRFMLFIRQHKTSAFTN